MQQPNSEILKQAAIFTANAEDFWMDASHNLWEVAHDSNNVIEYKLTGYAADGTPRYDAGTRYGFPSQLSDVRRIDVEPDGSVYLAGFRPSDRDLSSDNENWKMMGPTLIKYPSLPTTGGWPTPAWIDTGLYNDNGSEGGVYTDGIAVNGNLVGITWLHSPNYSQGRVTTVNTTNRGRGHRLIRRLAPATRSVISTTSGA